MIEYTPTQGRYLSFLIAYIEAYGEAPAESDIAQAMQVSAPSVNAMVRKLESLGLITREAGVSRSIAIPKAIPGLPRWRGRMPRRAVSMWAPKGATQAQLREIASRIRPQRPRSVPKASRFSVSAGDIYQLKITLRDTKPPVWRRIEIPPVTLADLHLLIQTAMGWCDSHMHEFQVGDRRFGPSIDEMPFGDFEDDDLEDETKITLAKLHRQKVKKIGYWYDFGDDWRHDVVIEKVLPAIDGTIYPICTAGKRACPPEDCGGVCGYQAILDGENEMLEDEDIEFDADLFEKDDATKAMQSIEDSHNNQRLG